VGIRFFVDLFGLKFSTLSSTNAIKYVIRYGVRREQGSSECNLSRRLCTAIGIKPETLPTLSFGQFLLRDRCAFKGLSIFSNFA